jgi:uncharacterized protein with ATP-grasp and redox domains
MGKEVTAVAKGGPIINDCTVSDALEAGLDGLCEVIDNGSDAVGTILETTPRRFRERFREAPLIISKGQGNFETLLGGVADPSPPMEPLGTGSLSAGEIFFLFQSKCGVVSEVLGLPIGAMLLAKGGRGVKTPP